MKKYQVYLNKKMNKILCICEFNECRLYLEDPVALPCGSTICLEHVKDIEKNFSCGICGNDHLVPENGFQINKTLNDLLKQGFHLNDMQKKSAKLFDKFDSLFREHELIDPQCSIHDSFFQTRNKLDLRKELLIERINKKSEEILIELNEAENECKMNCNNLIKSNLNELKEEVFSLKQGQLRNPKLNDNELIYLYNDINDIVRLIDFDIERFKKKIFMNEKIEFVSSPHSLNFGDLIITSNETNISESFGTLLKSYYGHIGRIRSILVDEKSNRLFSACDDNSIKIWDLESGLCLNTIKKHKEHIISLVLAPNNRLISGSMDRTIRVWELDSYKCKQSFSNSQVLSLCLLSDDELACGCSDGIINIWTVWCVNDYFYKRTSIEAHIQSVTSLKLSNDSLKLISGSDDKIIKIWHSETFKLIRELLGHSDIINCLEMRYDDTLLSGSSDKTIRLWNMRKNECLKVIKLDGCVNCIKSIKEDAIIILVKIEIKSKNDIIIYNLDSNEILKKFTPNLNYLDLILLSNGHLLSSSDNGRIDLLRCLASD
jgi:WD40 repeat protein